MTSDDFFQCSKKEKKKKKRMEERMEGVKEERKNTNANKRSQTPEP